MLCFPLNRRKNDLDSEYNNDMQNTRKEHVNGMQRLMRVLLWTATILLMLLIFGFSSETAEESDSTSAIITRPVTELLAKTQGSITAEEKNQLYTSVDRTVRKTAHFCEYALLGLLAFLLLRSYGLRAWWLAWLLTTLYAVSDEVHQLFQNGRAGQLSDVLLDSFGAFCGVMLVRLTDYLRRNQHVSDQ